MIASKEMRNAWFKFKESYKSSGRDGCPSITSFSTGWNMAMESLKQPVQPPVKTRTGYVVVNYTLFREDFPTIKVFTDGLGKECIVADDTFSSYIDGKDVGTGVGVYKSRKEARQESYDNNEDPDFHESVWKVELDQHNNIVKWIKKNP